jgi:phage-related protein
METHQKKRTVVFFGAYFEQFFRKQRQKVKDKIMWTLSLIEELEIVPETYLKHLEGTCGLYEIRVQHAGDIYRIFCFFDEGKLVVVINGFQKKTQKTPKGEIEMALKIKQAYDGSQ